MGVVDKGDGKVQYTTNSFNEKQVTEMLNRSKIGSMCKRWISCGSSTCGIRMNWITSFLAVVLTWGFAIICLSNPNAGSSFADGKKWVAQNFTWLYILTQDVWCGFLIYLCFSRFAKIKLGKDNEVPRFNDFTWFSMLFTCGVAVGLYVFGVAEPLYFYRQPTSWLPGSSYAHTKVSIDNDANRAQQAIFMAVYHWGIHGWVPYILLALTVGIVSFRWGMPMTIRSCFYPLLGDHSLGLFGDMIDALSIATTTFGVCTSLGLGVSQLSSGLGFVKNIGCDMAVNCAAAGGSWSLDGYGKENCLSLPSGVTYDTCSVSWQADAASKTNSYYTLIGVITILATISVISGLDRGIKTLALAAITCGFIVMIFVLYADNTWYIFNVMVQTTGYYLQYVIQVGFDCEAFQQQAFEWQSGGGKLWMAYPIGERMAAAGVAMTMSSNNCGSMVNPCKQGVITIAAALAGSGTPAAKTVTATLKAFKMSPDSISELKAKVDAFVAAGISTNVPCGSGWNTTHYDTWSAWALNGAVDAPLNAAVTGTFPRCPETITTDVMSWGQCEKFQASCPIQQTYYGDTNKMFMDWWTIFYWAWWITWAPFVGFFVALISRGRTVREVIIGGFICPTLYAIMWFSVFGGLAIKMQRTAEMALEVAPDVMNGGITCSEHYSGGVPITPKAKHLAKAGYYMLTCMPKDNQIYHIMEPYANVTGFLQFFLWLGLVIYFLTSSDSGSMTDDIISASGLSAERVPWWQKVFWCWTEGLVAIALVNTGGALRALQALSIVIGLPYTVLLCMMVPSLYRLVKKEAGDEDIAKSYKFNTQLGDIFELFSPKCGSPCSPGKHITTIALALVAPFIAVMKIFKHMKPEAPMQAMITGLVAQCFHLAWLIFMIVEWAGGGRNSHNFAWLWFTFFLCVVIFARVEMRYKHEVWGSVLDDIFAGMFLWPIALAQMQMMAETDGKDKPLYWKDADELIATMASVSDDGDSAATGTAKPSAAEV